LAVGLVVFVSFRTNKEGYPFETSTDDKYFFSSETADGFDVRCLARSYRHLARNAPIAANHHATNSDT